MAALVPGMTWLLSSRRVRLTTEFNEVRPVGWVERSETHRAYRAWPMGFAALNPSYKMSRMTKADDQAGVRSATAAGAAAFSSLARSVFGHSSSSPSRPAPIITAPLIM